MARAMGSETQGVFSGVVKAKLIDMTNDSND
jgi:hypothetical protein